MRLLSIKLTSTLPACSGFLCEVPEALCLLPPHREAVRPGAALHGLCVLVSSQLRGGGDGGWRALPAGVCERLRMRPGTVPGGGVLCPREPVPLLPPAAEVPPGRDPAAALQSVVSWRGKVTLRRASVAKEGDAVWFQVGRVRYGSLGEGGLGLGLDSN